MIVAGLILPVGNAYAVQPDLSTAEIQQIFPDLRREAAPDNRYGALVARVAQHLNLEAGLIDAVIARESNYQADAVSPSGAIGLMQLMPGGGARDAYEHLYGHPGRPSRAGLKRPDVNIWLGSAYLRVLEDRYYRDYQYSARIPFMLAAYNWGIGNMLADAPDPARIRTRAAAMGWIEKRCPAETRRYVKRVLSLYDAHRRPGTLYREAVAVIN